MAGLCWMAVMLTFFLSAENSLAAVDQNWLASVIQGIKNEYALGDSFSLAVNIPKNQDINSLQQVFQDDPADRVKQTVSEGNVYQGTRVVAAAQSEALSRLLENIRPLHTSSQGNFLVIYSEESPCGPTCTTNANSDSTAGKFNDIIQNWSGYAFVFSKVVDVPAADASQLAESFKQLGVSKLGLDNIFRCHKPGDDPFQCTSCSSGGDVTPSCVANRVKRVGRQVRRKRYCNRRGECKRRDGDDGGNSNRVPRKPRQSGLWGYYSSRQRWVMSKMSGGRGRGGFGGGFGRSRNAAVIQVE